MRSTSLTHHGILGMHWGVRKDRAASADKRVAKYETKRDAAATMRAHRSDISRYGSTAEKRRQWTKEYEYNAEKWRRKADAIRAKSFAEVDQSKAKDSYSKAISKTSQWTDKKFNSVRRSRITAYTILGAMVLSGTWPIIKVGSRHVFIELAKKGIASNQAKNAAEVAWRTGKKLTAASQTEVFKSALKTGSAYLINEDGSLIKAGIAKVL